MKDVRMVDLIKTIRLVFFRRILDQPSKFLSYTRDQLANWQITA